MWDIFEYRKHVSSSACAKNLSTIGRSKWQGTRFQRLQARREVYTAMSSRWFKALLADLANELTPSDLEIIRYLYELKGSQSSLDTLHALSQRRVFSERNTDPLVTLLSEVGRADLAELCRERVSSAHA